MGWLDEMTFLTIRHGLSDGQMRPQTYREVGDTAVSLFSPTGFEQARSIAPILDEHIAENFPNENVVIISSPHLRAVQTMITYGSCIISVPITEVRYAGYLGEQRFGGMNGMTPDEAEAKYSKFLIKQKEAQATGARHLLKMPDCDTDNIPGESQHDVWRRTKQIIQEAKDLYNMGIRVVIINTHGSAGRAAQMNILGIESSDKVWKEWKKPNNCQIDQIRHGQRTTICKGFDEPKRSHRPDLRLVHPPQVISRPI